MVSIASGEIYSQPERHSAGFRFTMIERKRGFGQNADKIFKTFIKVTKFIRNEQYLETELARLRQGMFVTVIGDTRAEGYEKNGEVKGSLNLVCQEITEVLFDDDGGNGNQPAPPAAGNYATPAPSGYAPAPAQAPAGDPPPLGDVAF